MNLLVINQYLKGIGSNIIHAQTMKAAQQYTLSINNIISQSIQQEKLQIPNIKKSFIRKKTVQNQQELNEIRQKKESALQLLRNLQKMQSEKKRDQIKQKLDHLTKEKSELTTEDIKILKSLLKKKKKLQLVMKQKDEEIKKQSLLLLQQEKIKQQEQIEQKRKMRRQKIIENLDKLKSEQQFRKQEYKRTQQLLEQTKKNEYLYLKSEQVFKKEQQKEKIYRQEQYKILKKLNEIHLDDIKNHQIKYKQIIERNKQEREKKMQYIRSNSMLLKNRYTLNPYIEDQMKLIQQQNKIKLQSPKKYKKRIIQYSEKIKNQHKLKIIPKITQIKQSSSLPTIKILSKQQINNIGENYLKIAKNLSKKKSQNNTQTSSPTQKERYYDYIKTIPDNLLDRYQYKQLARIRNILNGQVKGYKNIFQANKQADRMQIQSGKNCIRLANSIQAKIDILNKII